MRLLSLIIGLILIKIAIVQYATTCIFWYYPGAIGMFLLFDNLCHMRGRKTTLDFLFEKKFKRFVLLYVGLAILALVIEILGMYFWKYTYFHSYTYVFIMTVIFYPPHMMGFKEMFEFVRTYLKNFPLSVIGAMILGIIIWEIPNIFSKDWIYSIPFISFEIFHINIIVIIGWVILILGPYYVYKLLKI